MMNVYAICYGLVLLFNFVWIIVSNRRKRKSYVSPLLTPEMNVYAPLSRLGGVGGSAGYRQLTNEHGTSEIGSDSHGGGRR